MSSRSLQATRAVVEGLHGQPVHPRPERSSLKPPGSAEWVAHLDPRRQGTYQVVIALTALEFLVWPRSHRLTFNHENKFYYKLGPGDLKELDKRGIVKHCVAARPGDILVMAGGVLVHSSPAVPATATGPRIATYAHWALTAAAEEALRSYLVSSSVLLYGHAWTLPLPAP